MKIGPISSQPTYEELKPDIPADVQQHLPGSQPTYEELKHNGRGYIMGDRNCSQPTYEELKRVLRCRVVREPRVPSLPMRN